MSSLLFEGMRSEAAISSCGLYRYSLSRAWSDESSPRIACFLMLNPSVADATRDDPTLTKCWGFARRWGMDGLTIVNLFAYRATKPAAMRRAPDPIGPDNDRHIVERVSSAELVVCAWGPCGTFRGRDREVMGMIRGLCKPKALRLTKAGHPWHPLMAAYSWEPADFDPAGE